MSMAVREKAFAETVALLAARWSAAGPLLAAFGLLAGGQPVDLSRLASEAETSVEEIENRLAAVRCERDVEGRLTGLFGLTLSRSAIALEIGGNIVYACCGLWAIVVPRLVKKPAIIRSADPVSGQPVRLVVSPVGIESLQPPGTMATLAVAGAEDIAADVGAAFCSHIRFFCSRETAEDFAQDSPHRYVVKAEELHRAGQDFFRAIWAGLED